MPCLQEARTIWRRSLQLLSRDFEPASAKNLLRRHQTAVYAPGCIREQFDAAQKASLRERPPKFSWWGPFRNLLPFPGCGGRNAKICRASTVNKRQFQPHRALITCLFAHRSHSSLGFSSTPALRELQEAESGPRWSDATVRPGAGSGNRSCRNALHLFRAGSVLGKLSKPLG